MDEISLKSELIKQNEELIHCLQNELVEIKLKEAENSVIMSDLRRKIQELEEDKKRLRESAVDNSVAHLQVYFVKTEKILFLLFLIKIFSFKLNLI